MRDGQLLNHDHERGRFLTRKDQVNETRADAGAAVPYLRIQVIRPDLIEQIQFCLSNFQKHYTNNSR